MILLRIISNDADIIKEIATTMLEEHMIIDANYKKHIERLSLKDGELISTPIYMLTAKTKALLFKTIDEKIRQMFPENLPEIYSLPIVHMDWDQSLQLQQEVTKV